MSVSFGGSNETKLGASRIEWRNTDQGLVAYVIKPNGRAEQVVWAPQPGSQEAFLSCPIIECLYEGTRGPGKSQPLDALVYTPSGPRRIGDIAVGDYVSGSNGKPVKVLGVYPQGVKPLCRITFRDGTSTTASPDHLWQTAATGAGMRWKKRILRTSEMRDWMAKGKTLSIPTMSGPWETQEVALPIDPYFMGLFLGDGCHQKYSVAITTTDQETIDYLLGLGFKFKAPISYRAPGTQMAHALRALGLENLTSADKFVPDLYLKGSAEQRLLLLQGLMDSDGSAKRDKNRLRFGSISPKLAESVAWLIRSLGGHATVYTLQRPDEDRPEFEVTGYLPDMASAFRLTRKKALVEPRDLQSPSSFVKKYVESIEDLEPVAQVCIAVDSLDHLYLTNDFIVTHNTDALIMDFCQDVGKGWGVEWRGIIFRKSYPDLQDIIEKSRKWIPRIWPGAKYNETKSFWEWPTGEKLYFRQFSKPSDYYKYHGHAYPFIGWEELTTWPDDKCFKSMFSCLRSTKVGMPRKVRATTNPYGVGHNWVKMRYQLPVRKGHIIGKIITDSKDDAGELELPRVAIHGYLDENKVLLTADPDYKKNIRTAARNPAELAAWLDGSWDIVAGGMFDDIWYMGKDYILTEPFKIPDSWRIDRSFDWGSNAPFSVGWWAESDGSDYTDAFGHRRSTVRGDLFRIAEWYGWTGKPNEGKRLLATEIARGIVEYELAMGWRQSHNRRWCRVRPGPADNAIFDDEQGRKKDDPNAKSKATDMGMPVRIENQLYPGITWEYSDKSPGSRKQGWEQMRAMMKAAVPPEKRIPPEEGLRERPGLFVFKTCDQFIRTVPALPRDENDMDDVDSEAEDHIGDECRYRVRFKKRNIKSGLTTGHY